MASNGRRHSDNDEPISPPTLWQRAQSQLIKLEQSHSNAFTHSQTIQKVRHQLDDVSAQLNGGDTSGGGGGSASSPVASASSTGPGGSQGVLKDKRNQLYEDLCHVYELGIQQAEQEQTLIQELSSTLKRLQKAVAAPAPSNETTSGSKGNGLRHSSRNGPDPQIDYDSASSTSSSQTPPGASITVGTYVAAKTSKPKDHNEEWILAEVTHYYPDRNKYQVEDVVKDESGENPKYSLSGRNLIPLPHPVPLSPNGTTVSSAMVSQQRQRALPKPTRQFQPRQRVLALYPNTTCFYRATITGSLDQDSTSNHYAQYALRFEDDGDVERRVHHSMVLDIPKAPPTKPKPY